ncbi:rCG24601, isoform CRA_a [Rattus norvegicus]|uniref:RCG24601, isoform CRA_a n=1 Tax=Rattus norvegicus TaxID=10116 RepID=A6JBW3_RAT|nr:rCG24601, isoform CRA_a [Rattus norvegicus]EDM08490.1 rCG24601, isoform CRA_a [Rattus norvegicus]
MQIPPQDKDYCLPEYPKRSLETNQTLRTSVTVMDSVLLLALNRAPHAEEALYPGVRCQSSWEGSSKNACLEENCFRHHHLSRGCLCPVLPFHNHQQ